MKDRLRKAVAALNVNFTNLSSTFNTFVVLISNTEYQKKLKYSCSERK